MRARPASTRSRRQFCKRMGVAAAAAVAPPALMRINSWAKEHGVEFGACAPVSEVAEAAAVGFDYLEPAASQIAALDDATFAKFRATVQASPIRCKSFNILLVRPDLRVVGTDVSRARLASYLEAVFPRCRELGGEIVVFGSGRSRSVPADFPRGRAWQQIQEFLHIAGDIARKNDLRIAIEPLRKAESNIINTGVEGWRLVKEVNHPNVKLLIDYYHLRQENEDPSIVWEARKDIIHFHFANPNGRLWPKQPSEDPVYARFFEIVKKMNFHGGISVEGHGSVAADGKQTVNFFRRELA